MSVDESSGYSPSPPLVLPKHLGKANGTGHPWFLKALFSGLYSLIVKLIKCSALDVLPLLNSLWGTVKARAPPTPPPKLSLFPSLILSPLTRRQMLLRKIMALAEPGLFSVSFYGREC